MALPSPSALPIPTRSRAPPAAAPSRGHPNLNPLSLSRPAPPDPTPRPGPPPHVPAQERATKVSHGNTARQAVEYGDEVLGKLCGAIASDESRHEIAYTRIVDEFFRWGGLWAPFCKS